MYTGWSSATGWRPRSVWPWEVPREAVTGLLPQIASGSLGERHDATVSLIVKSQAGQWSKPFNS